MNRFATAAFAAATLLLSQSVSAQTSGSSSSAGMKSLLHGLTFAVGGDLTVTKKTGGGVTAEIITKEYRPKVQFSVEGGWFSSVVNGQRIDSAAVIATYLAQTQQQAASATVKVPAGFGAVNVRYTVYRKPKWDLYAIGGGGFAVTSPKTTAKLGGTDVSGSLSQYLVTVGTDLSGSSFGGLANVGLGASMPHGKWIGDISYRMSPMFTKGGTTFVNRLNFAIGRKF